MLSVTVCGSGITSPSALQSMMTGWRLRFRVYSKTLSIRNVLKEASITIAQLAENLNVDERTIGRDITTLQKAGILHREGGRKNGGRVTLDRVKFIQYENILSNLEFCIFAPLF